MSRALRFLFAPLMAACPADAPIPASGDDTNDEPEGSSTIMSAPTSADDPTGSSTSATSTGEHTSTGTTDAAFDPPVPMCGNGYLEADEECDDGNTSDGDGCTAACLIPCGLEREYIELAPSAQSIISGARVLGAADGGVVVVGELQEITLDMEGVADKGPVKVLVIAYDAEGNKRWEQRIGPGDADLEVGGGAIDASGDVFIAGAVEGSDGSDVYVGKLAGDDGEAVWSSTHDGMLADSDDVPRGLAVAPDGDVVVSAQVYDVAQDSDVWLRKIKGSTGAAVWTTTWSGEMDNGYSIDRGHDVAVDDDGNVFALAIEYVNYKRLETTLLKFGPNGGEPLWTATPLADGSDHSHEPSGLTVDAAGDVVFSVSRYGAAPTFWMYKYASNGDLVWEMDRGDFETGGEDWTMGGISRASDGDLLVAGYFLNEDPQGDASWVETWLARLAPDGTRHCQVSVRGVSDDLIPPSLYAYDVAGGAGDVALVTGQVQANTEVSLWTAVFRPL